MDNIVEKLKEQLPKRPEMTDDDHNETTLPRPKPLVIKRSVCYIVSAVVIVDNQVLMMREAKKSCRGLWYLPAGRVESDETLVDATKREVFEETGLLFEPTSLVSIEAPTLNWMRFNFTGQITGGRLKVTEDNESMEACWYPVNNVLSRKIHLRASDILPVIKLTEKWIETKKMDPLYTIIPRLNPHPNVTIEVIVVAQKPNGIQILIEQKMGILKTTLSNGSSFRDTASLLVKGAFMVEQSVNIIGVIRVEHSGGPKGVADGCCFTVLAILDNLTSAGQIKSAYNWQIIHDENIKEGLIKLCDQGCLELL